MRLFPFPLSPLHTHTHTLILYGWGTELWHLAFVLLNLMMDAENPAPIGVCLLLDYNHVGDSLADHL